MHNKILKQGNLNGTTDTLSTDRLLAFSFGCYSARFSIFWYSAYSNHQPKTPGRIIDGNCNEGRIFPISEIAEDKYQSVSVIHDGKYSNLNNTYIL